ncbi:serine/threonine-protein kinase [Nocardioides montaniterrae]
MSTPASEPRYADANRRYRLDERIATGGMGVVWKATDTRLNRVVAVKVLKHEYADDATFRTRFETEARHAAALHHPGIAGVFDYSADAPEGGAPFLVMEHVDGQPLSMLLSAAKESGRAMDPEVVRDLMAQTADALAVAHAAGIVHRDVKPANLLITPDRQVKVTDFGIARAGDATAITRTGAVMGTPQYLSPEQARGNPSSPASDVYSLGCVAFECLANKRPFEADTPVATLLAHIQQPVPQLPPAIPGDIARVVTRALAKEPADRFADGAAFAAALRNPSGVKAAPVVAPVPVPAADTGPATAVLPATAVTPTPAPPMERLDAAAAYAGDERRGGSPWPAVGLVLVLVVIALLIAWLLLRGGGDNTPTTYTSSPPARTHHTKPTAPSSSAATTVTVDPNAYIGRDFHDVYDDLTGLGLDVTLDQVDNDGTHTADLVSGVNPSGKVPVGSLVTVQYYGPAPATSSAAPTTSAPPTTSAAPTSSAPPSSSSPAAGGNPLTPLTGGTP